MNTPALSPTPVICVSHGFQTNYERGFCNGLAARGVVVTLIGSDRSDTAGLLPGVTALNLRGSQEEDRPRRTKALNLLRYHARLMLHALRHRDATLHVMGLLAPLFGCGVVQGLWFRALCRRYVLTVHDVLPHEQHTAYSRRVPRLPSPTHHPALCRCCWCSASSCRARASTCCWRPCATSPSRSAW